MAGYWPSSLLRVYVYTELRVYFEKLWYLSCNGVQGTSTFSHDCSNYFKSCDCPFPPPPPKKKPPIEQVTSHLKPPSPLLPLELNPLVQPFFFDQELFPLRSLIAFHCC